MNEAKRNDAVGRVFLIIQSPRKTFPVILDVLSFHEGSDWLSLHRCHHDSAEAGGLDPSPGQARGGLLPHPGRPVDQLGGRDEGEDAGKEECGSVRTLRSHNISSQVELGIHKTNIQ